MSISLFRAFKKTLPAAALTSALCCFPPAQADQPHDNSRLWPHIPKTHGSMAPERCIAEYQKLEAAGKFDNCLKLLNICLRDRPDVVALYYYRAKTYMQLKDYQKAILDCTRQIKLEPTLAKPYEMRGKCYLQLKDNRHAFRDYMRVVEMEPGNKLAHWNLANIYRQEGDIRNYKRELRMSKSNKLPEVVGKGSVSPAVLTRHDHPVSGLLQNAGEYLAHKKPGLALEEIKKVLKLSDQDFAVEHFDRGEAYDLQAQAFQQMDLHDEAIEALDKLLKFQPNNNRANYLKAQSYFAQGKYEECLACCNKASRGDKILSNTVAELRAKAEERLKRRREPVGQLH
jgi:tetratricopeptide (TPR) repeat protein